jgi:hypothetical protein
MREWLILFALSPFSLTAQIYAGGSGDGYAYQETTVSFTGIERLVAKQDTFIARDSTFNSQFPVFYDVPKKINWHLSDMNGRIVQVGYGDVSFFPGMVTPGVYLMQFHNDKMVQIVRWTFY